jgi:hypothetical protein
MFVDQIADAIETAGTARVLDDLARVLWQGLASGIVSEGEATRLSEAIEARRGGFRARAGITGPGERKGRPPASPALPRRYPQRDRSRSLERRRHLASSGPMPPALAARFTTGELAVLKIVSDDVFERAKCDRSIGEIAARAGVGRTTVQNAIRHATQIGLLHVQERRLTGWRNDTNVLTITSTEWLAWLARGRRQSRPGGGFKYPHPTVMNLYSEERKAGFQDRRARFGPGENQTSWGQKGRGRPPG